MNNRAGSLGPRPTSGWASTRDNVFLDTGLTYSARRSSMLVTAETYFAEIPSATMKMEKCLRMRTKMRKLMRELQKKIHMRKSSSKVRRFKPWLAGFRLIMAINRSTLTTDISCESARPSFPFSSLPFFDIDRHGTTCLRNGAKGEEDFEQRQAAVKKDARRRYVDTLRFALFEKRRGTLQHRAPMQSYGVKWGPPGSKKGRRT